MSRRINGVTLPTVDGILLDGGRLCAVQFGVNQIVQIGLSPGMAAVVLAVALLASCTGATRLVVDSVLALRPVEN